MFDRREYQEQAIASLRALRGQGLRRLLLVAPTGSGKTVMAGKIIQGAVAKGSPCLFLAHRQELIDQAHKRFQGFGVEAGVIKAGRPATPGALVQIASVQTLVRREAMPPAAIVVIDEAHLSAAESYQRILRQCPDATVIGLTATPIRFDGRGLRDRPDSDPPFLGYQDMVVAARVDDLVANGTLVRPRIFAPSRPDLSGVRIEGGDYARGQLAEAVDKPELVGDIVATWLRLAAGRRTVVFAASVEHSRHICEAFRAADVAAAHLDGTTDEDERTRILADLEAGALTVVCNYGVLTEGWDSPATSVCILARPTKSVGLYLQMVGRVLRAWAGKGEALVLDHAGCVLDPALGHPLEPREWSLDGKPKREGAPPVRQCPTCFAIAPGGVRACPECGEVFEVKAKTVADGPATREGELVELTEMQLAARRQARSKTTGDWKREHPDAWGKGATTAGQAALYRALKAWAAPLAYKPAWPAIYFKVITGHPPSKAVREAARARQEVAG